MAILDHTLNLEDWAGKTSGPLTVRVRSITHQAEDVNAYEVADPDGKALPRFTAGAHLDFLLKDGRVRQYSLCNDPRETHRYVFAVQREALGRGGSKAIFETVQVGDLVSISKPRNNFRVASEAVRHLFLAGGIGITPMMSMISEVRSAGGRFELHYCTRSREKTVFLEEMLAWQREGKAFLYHDKGDPKQGLNLAALLWDYRPGTHLYYCGPPGFMEGVRKAASHWPKDAIHFEYFNLPAHDTQFLTIIPGTCGEAAEFQVRLAASGLCFDIPKGKSIAEVLRENGISVSTSCESGLCGTCKTQYIEGKPDHRDYILSDEEKLTSVLICCARSFTPLIVLDL